ncbi:hypothetical protein KPH14_002846 [Odynerus spinipes]|uniref:Uncharacterized protein n=1 Tax=Odynerus spinipes TaxID=1348599 RepID=A0AAD9RG08_9HYME|nr:hypothetical protein KPH14_002846 [Odynerus spinipes]
MDLQNLSLYLLVLVALFANGDSKIVSLDPDNQQITANFDKIFDQLLPTIQKIIKENGMDPMELRSFSEKILPLPGRLKGNINFRNGFLHYMSEVTRAKHVTAQYSDKRLLLDMTLGWQRLDFSYEYDFTYLLIKRRGDVYGRFEDPAFNVLIELDLNNYEVILHRVQFIRVGNVSVKFYGHKLDSILNSIIKPITPIFENRILKMVEDKSLMLFEPVIDSVNKWIKNSNHKIHKLIASF